MSQIQNKISCLCNAKPQMLTSNDVLDIFEKQLSDNIS